MLYKEKDIKQLQSIIEGRTLNWTDMPWVERVLRSVQDLSDLTCILSRLLFS